MDSDVGRGVSALLLALSARPPFQGMGHTEAAEVMRKNPKIDDPETVEKARLANTSNGLAAMMVLNDLIIERQTSAAAALRQTLYRILTQDAVDRVAVPDRPLDISQGATPILNSLTEIRENILIQQRQSPEPAALYSNLIYCVDALIRASEPIDEDGHVAPQYIQSTIRIISDIITQGIKSVMGVVISSNSVQMLWMLQAWANICKCTAAWIKVAIKVDEVGSETSSVEIIFAKDLLPNKPKDLKELLNVLDRYQASAYSAARPYEYFPASQEHLSVSGTEPMATGSTIPYVKVNDDFTTQVQLFEKDSQDAMLQDIIAKQLKLYDIYGDAGRAFVRHVIKAQVELSGIQFNEMTKNLDPAHIQAAALAFNLSIHLAVIHSNKTTMDVTEYVSTVSPTTHENIWVVCKQTKNNDGTTNTTYVYLKTPGNKQHEEGRLSFPDTNAPPKGDGEGKGKKKGDKPGAKNPQGQQGQQAKNQQAKNQQAKGQPGQPGQGKNAAKKAAAAARKAGTG
jgi:hypothetical protein